MVWRAKTGGETETNVQVLEIVQARDGKNKSPSPLRTQAS